MKRHYLGSHRLGLFLLAAIVLTAGQAHAQDTCCFNNYRFAGGCAVVPSGTETCNSILSYLNSFDSVGSHYCGNTTVRGGWTITGCSDGSITSPQSYQSPPSPGYASPREPVQQTQPKIRATEPRNAPGASDASLMKVSAPLQVRFDGSVDSAALDAGQPVIGRLEQDLMSGDTLIAPAGSEVQALLVPTSFWGDGAGDAFQIQTTAVKVGDRMIPVSATAIAATGEIATEGAEVKVPEGSLVSFEASVSPADSSDIAVLKAAAAIFMEAFNTEDAETLAALFTEDGVMLPPNAPAIFGRDAIRASSREDFAMMDQAIELEDLEITVEGDLGYKAGRYRVRSEKNQLIDRGKYIEIWRKVDGQWLIHRDIWNSSMPKSEKHSEEHD
jgi:uncharacterized protein (TIGR02246 family)